VDLGDFDVDDAELFVNEVATDGDLQIDYIARKLWLY
jgi:death-on-curing protein